MRVAAAIALAALFLLAFVSGNVYAPAAAVAVLALLVAAMFINSHGKISRKNLVLGLWIVLLSHRAFIFRGGSVQESGSLFFVEVGVTLLVFLGAMVALAPIIGNLRIKAFDARFWLLAYTAFAGISLLWTPAPVYAGFWFIRLSCVAILLIVYFADATMQDCKKFFAATILGSVPVLMLPIIAYATHTSMGLSGSNRVLGYWAHPGVVSITAFSIAAACLAAILQRDGGPRNRRFYFYASVLAIGFAGGFLAAGKTGAIGGAVAVSLMLLIGGRLRLWLGMLVVAGIGYVVFTVFLQDMQFGLIAHARNYNFERSSTVHGRISLWSGALAVWWESFHSVILGRGFTSFRAANLASLTGWAPGHAHNSFVNLLVDMGILGGFTFVAIIFRTFSAATVVALGNARRFGESAAFPLYIGLISLLVGSLMDDVFGGTLQPPTYLFIGTVIALDRMVYLLKSESADLPSPGYRISRQRGGKLQPVLEISNPSE